MWLLTAHALPMFREPRQRSTRKQLEKDRLDPLKSHKPEPPVAGPGDWSSRFVCRGRRGQGSVIDTEVERASGPEIFLIFRDTSGFQMSSRLAPESQCVELPGM
jgi:hypothetical protein